VEQNIFRPLVSIVTPSLNQAQFITQTIESVLSQTYSPLEYWVIDGGSTDGTLEILHDYRDRLRWISEPDNGQAAAINKGWRLTRGEIIAYLNADDAYLPSAITHAVQYLSAHPQVDAVYGDCDYVDEQGKFIRAYPTSPYNYAELVRSTLDYIPQPSMFVRRRAAKKIGYLDETLHCALDFDCWLRLGRHYAIAYLPQRLATLRLHPAAKSLKQLARFASELIRIYHNLFSLPDLPPPIRRLRREAMSNIYYRASSCAFWGGDHWNASRYALIGWGYAPLNVRRQLFLAVSGKTGRRLLERRRGNPYLLGV
jgi:glycosyltransferase involved in cell wall biosynthesis